MLVLGTISLGAAGALTPSRIAFYSFIVPAGITLALSLGLAGRAGSSPRRLGHHGVAHHAGDAA